MHPLPGGDPCQDDGVDLATINTRMLIVHGDRDEFFPIAIPLQMHRAIPRFKPTRMLQLRPLGRDSMATPEFLCHSLISADEEASIEEASALRGSPSRQHRRGLQDRAEE